MTETDTPSGGNTAAGGSVAPGRPDEQALAALPDKVRVHALARVVGTSSRELLAVLARLGVGARSAQSSVDRDVVARVVDDVFPSADLTAVGAAPVAESHAGASTPAEPDTDRDAAPVDTDGDTATTLLPPPAASTPSAPSAAPVFAAPMFLAPDPGPSDTDAPAAPARSRRRRGTRSTGVVTPGETPETETTGDPAPAEPEDDDTVGAAAPAADDETTDTSPATGPDADDGDDDEGGRRRRRRGRRGRGRGRGGSDDAEDGTDESGGESGSDSGSEPGSSEDTGTDEGSDDESTDDTESSDEGESGDESSGGGSRRRRRRRRRSSEGDDSDGDEPDPPNTVVHVRDRVERPEGGKSSNDEVRGVKGSTRLEAKRQRRRDGRESGRRRPAILSESEFLARREAVERTMVVRQQAGRSQIAVLEDGVLVEHFIAGDGQNSMVGNVYLGRVQNVLPSMEAAFVDIGRGRNAVLYAGEVNWDASGLEGKQRKIEQALSSGDQVLVQVTKDPVGHKGARLTTQISLPGRFLVFVPSGGATGISRKLPDTERKRLKEILKRIVPDESGVIIRTAAEGVSEDELERDVRRLTAQWDVIEKTAHDGKGSKGPTLVYEEPDLLIRVVRDMFNEDFSSLVVSGERAWETLEGYVSHVAPELAGRLTRHTGPEDVFAAHRIDEQLIKALDRKVWLPSGGTLVIDRTEAMTVVDVNTGKFTGSGGNLEETVTRNNLEAAEEIVRQLRLRDIGGMIVIDFIDMVLESNRDLVLRRLTECLGRDRTRHQVSEVTSLGLVQMTRKRVGQGLLDEFSTTCEHCRGRGVIVHTDPVAVPDQGGSSNGSGNGAQSSGNGSGASNGSGNGASGSGGAGSGGSGRRGRRGRRGGGTDSASPATVAAASGLTGTMTEEGTASPDTVDDAESPDSGAVTPPEPAGTPVAGATESEVSLEAGVADASPGTTEPSAEDAPEAPDAPEGDADADAAEAAEAAATPGATVAAGVEDTDEEADEVEEVEEAIREAVEAEVALETDLAEHVPVTNGAAPEQPSSPPRITGAIGATAGNGHGADPALVTPAGTGDDPQEPLPEKAAPPSGAGRPRRRRAASRPAGPPVDGA
jgi:ribonuclease E